MGKAGREFPHCEFRTNAHLPNNGCRALRLVERKDNVVIVETHAFVKLRPWVAVIRKLHLDERVRAFHTRFFVRIHTRNRERRSKARYESQFRGIVAEQEH